MQVARALERRNGLGDAANLPLTFDRDAARRASWMPSFTGAMQPVIVRYDTAQRPLRRHVRDRQRATAPRAARLRFTGTAIETVEAAVLARNVERNEVAEIVRRGGRAPPEGRSRHRRLPRRDRAVGMQARQPAARRPGDCGPPISPSPTWCSATRTVTLIYEAAGLYLTMRGKALDNGTEGDVVNVIEPAVEAHAVRHRDRAAARSRSRPPSRHARAADQRCHLLARRNTAAPVAVATASSPVAPKAE